MAESQFCIDCLLQLEAGEINAKQVQRVRAKRRCVKHYRAHKRAEAGAVPRATDLGATEQLTVRLPVRVAKKLRADATRENCTIAELIRRLVAA